ncbi:non-ribosomal peptide synthetase [Allohahella sp. A8]|uniref:non-ribosomal peptide synthetase n=1 Tax=Allohahella sp. A8 TaxID=3141461 RepID=UPI003A7F84E0
MTQQPGQVDFETTNEDGLEAYALSPQQVRLWQWQPSAFGAHSGARLTIRLTGEADPVRLKTSLAQLSQRHEILRTRYQRVPGMRLPVQVIASQPLISSPEDTETLPVQLVCRPLDDGSSEVQLNLPAAHLDTASLVLLTSEWAALYAADSPDALEAGLISDEPPLQYADYAPWRQELIGSEAAAQAFWENQLKTARPLTTLPLYKSIPALGDKPSLVQRAVAMPDEAMQDWLNRAQGLAVAPEVLLLSTWVTLLHQHSESETISLGLDWQQRSSHLGDALGLFSELLPLTVSGLGTMSFEALCRQLAHQCSDLLEWRDYFPSEHPEADKMTGFAAAGFRLVSNIDTEALLTTGWSLTQADSATAPCQLLLELQMGRVAANATGEPGSNPTKLILHFNPEVFSEAAIMLIQDQLLCLLHSACATPQLKLSDLAALTSSQQRQLDTVLSGTLRPECEQPYQAIASLHNLSSCFETQSRLHPHAPAVKGLSGSLSYGQLDQRADRLANTLRSRGVGTGTRIVHFLRRDLDALVAMLAILKAGAVYVPVDPAYPSSRIAYILSDSQAMLCITSSELTGDLPEGWQDPQRLVMADAAVTSDAPAPEGIGAPDIQGHDPAYIIYTSGSTGEPKGVVITHANALHSLAARVAYYPEPVQHFLSLSSFAFDSSIAGLFWSLAQGGCLHLATESQQKDPAVLATIIAEEGITHLLALPSLYQLLLHSLNAEACQLKTSIVAGEACPRALVNLHYSSCPHVRLYNEYGPTEASVWSTVAECTVQRDEAAVAIGRPIPHTRVRLLDAKTRQVAQGLKGEIFIGGAGLSPGYLDRPALTAEKFITLEGERLYRTGDFAYIDEYGEFVFLGRADAQVKIRGYRIEPGEIEAVLCRQPAVQSAAVIAVPDQTGAYQLRAFVASEADLGADAAAESLHKALAAQLPAHMLPAEIQVLPRLPRSANGKIDRQALAAIAPRQQRVRYVAPEGEVERDLAALWETLLEVEQIGREDDFFALGGHSLLVVRLTHSIQSAFQVEVPISLVFQHPTLRQLAGQISRRACSPGLVVLNEGQSSHPPLFCLHQPSGEVHHYRPLVAAMPAEQPVYGIPLPRGLNADNSSLTALAERYAAEIRQQQPQGPYHLCGWSMGGLLALELARQLERAGETVALLAMIDTTYSTNDEAIDFEQVLTMFENELTPDSAARFRSLPPSELEALRSRIGAAGKAEQLRYLLLEWRLEQDLALTAPVEVVRLTLDAMRQARQWVQHYEPRPAKAHLCCWWAEDTLAAQPDLPDYWSTLANGKVQHYIVPGDHDDILSRRDFKKQFVGMLAQAQRNMETVT